MRRTLCPKNCIGSRDGVCESVKLSSQSELNGEVCEGCARVWSEWRLFCKKYKISKKKQRLFQNEVSKYCTKNVHNNIMMFDYFDIFSIFYFQIFVNLRIRFEINIIMFSTYCFVTRTVSKINECELPIVFKVCDTNCDESQHVIEKWMATF